MTLGKYIKEIGRGRDGARSLSREQAADMFAHMLDGEVTDLEIGAVCLAMRIKGESAQEMAGFLDATENRLNRIPIVGGGPAVVIPSYNGARKLPLLTPLLAMLLAREGLPVVVHGVATETSRVFTSEVFAALDIPARSRIEGITSGELGFFPTSLLCPGLQRLLDVRRVVGLRNSAHSLVKLMNPVDGANMLVTSYTHPEYATSMAKVIEMTQVTALLLRGTEGESVADPRRTPKFQGFIKGYALTPHEHQAGPLQELPDFPHSIDAQSTARYTRALLSGKLPVPAPILQQVAYILQVVAQLN